MSFADENRQKTIKQVRADLERVTSVFTLSQKQVLALELQRLGLFLDQVEHQDSPVGEPRGETKQPSPATWPFKTGGQRGRPASGWPARCPRACDPLGRKGLQCRTCRRCSRQGGSRRSEQR